MKKYIIALAVLLLMALAIVGYGKDREYENVDVYFVDAQMMRLVKVNTEIENDDVLTQAKEVIDALICGHDDNKKIHRVIPKIKNGMSVKVFEGIAYVDIKKEMQAMQKKTRTAESLAVYSIVNSLVSIDGIRAVRFTINGVCQKDYAGFIDMRETFLYNDIY